MRLFNFKSQYCPKNYHQKEYIRFWRWYLSVERNGIGLNFEVVYKDFQSKVIDWYYIGVNKTCKFKRHKDYYDGPLDRIDLGPIHISWRDWNRED